MLASGFLFFMVFGTLYILLPMIFLSPIPTRGEINLLFAVILGAGLTITPTVFTLFRAQYSVYSSPFKYYLQVRLNRTGFPKWEPEFRNSEYAKEFAAVNPKINVYSSQEFKIDNRIGLGLHAGFWMAMQLFLFILAVGIVLYPRL
jgi:hypothetical protein